MTAKGYTILKPSGANKGFRVRLTDSNLLAGGKSLYAGQRDTFLEADEMAISYRDALRSARELLVHIKANEPTLLAGNRHPKGWTPADACPFSTGKEASGEHLPRHCVDCAVGLVKMQDTAPALADWLWLCKDLMSVDNFQTVKGRNYYNLMGLHKRTTDRPVKAVGKWQQEQEIREEIRAGSKVWNSEVKTYHMSDPHSRFSLQFDRGRALMNPSDKWRAIIK